MNSKEIYADTMGIKKLNDWFKLEKWRLINLRSSKGGREDQCSMKKAIKLIVNQSVVLLGKIQITLMVYVNLIIEIVYIRVRLEHDTNKLKG